MEHGESSNGKKLNAEEIAAMTKMTVEKIKSLYSSRRLGHNTTVTFHDMTSAGYGWLLPGWVAEERRVESGRIYRYYYDPDGEYYPTQKKVLDAFKERGVIVVDT